MSREASESGRRLLQVLTRLVNLILAGRIPHFVQRVMFSASLCALKKKDGGVRPKAVGSFYMRLAGRIAAKDASISTSNTLLPIQLDVGVPQGCEAAVHTCREYTSHCLEDPSFDKVLIKVDMRNAFNNIRHDKMCQITNRSRIVQDLIWSAEHWSLSATNVNIMEQSWIQASLLARLRGLGVHAVSSLTLPCFVASLKSSLPLARIICPMLVDGQPESLTSAICHYADEFGATVVPMGQDHSPTGAPAPVKRPNDRGVFAGFSYFY